MSSRFDALALAVVLSSGDEVLLGPTDSAMCAEALRVYSRTLRRRALAGAFRGPATIAALCLGMFALVPLTDPKATAGGDVARAENLASTVTDLVSPFLAGASVRPIPHSSPAELTAQRNAAAYKPSEG